jgi:hypothetical protein
MSFKLLAILVVFLCLSYGTDAGNPKDWLQDKFNDAKQQISKRFNRESLEKFLEGGPQLWVVRSDRYKFQSFFVYSKKPFRPLKNCSSEKVSEM